MCVCVCVCVCVSGGWAGVVCVVVSVGGLGVCVCVRERESWRFSSLFQHRCERFVLVIHWEASCIVLRHTYPVSIMRYLCGALYLVFNVFLILTLWSGAPPAAPRGLPDGGGGQGGDDQR